MSLYRSYDMAYCARCKGERPHSKRGRCLAFHRKGKKLRYERTPAERERWDAAKRLVFQRDGYSCQYPGPCDIRGLLVSYTFLPAGLDAHHRMLRGAGGTSDEDLEYGPANLISLCRSHHDYVHNKLPRTEAERLGLIIPRSSRVAPSSVPVHTPRGCLLLDDAAGYDLTEGWVS